jgi:hypothetical protein
LRGRKLDKGQNMAFSRGELEEIIAGVRPAAVKNTKTFDGGVTGGKLSTKAAATTSLTGTNNDMTFTADTAGVAGNSITVAYYTDRTPVSNGSSVAHCAGTTITVDLKTNGSGVSTALASEVKTAIEANAEAAALVDITDFAGNDGTGVVTAMSAITLSGGSDGKVSLFRVSGTILCSLRGYCATSLTGTNATLVHGVTGTTNMLIPILTSTNITVGKGIDSTSAVVARGTALTKVPLWYVADEDIFATTATAATTAGKIHYFLDYIALTEGATVTAL